MRYEIWDMRYEIWEWREKKRTDKWADCPYNQWQGQAWLLLVDIKWMLSLLNNKYITVNLVSTELTDSSLSAPLFLHHSPPSSLPIDEMQGDRSWSPTYHYKHWADQIFVSDDQWGKHQQSPPVLDISDNEQNSLESQIITTVSLSNICMWD